MKQLDIDPGHAPDVAVHHGGPVEPGRGFILHSTDWGGQDTLQVNGPSGAIFAWRRASMPPSAINLRFASRESAAARMRGSGFESGWLRVL